MIVGAFGLGVAAIMIALFLSVMDMFYRIGISALPASGIIILFLTATFVVGFTIDTFASKDGVR